MPNTLVCLYHTLVSFFENPFVMSILTLSAAYFAGRLLYLQQRRWSTEDARNVGVDIYFPCPGVEYVNEGWFLGEWRVYNRAKFPLKLLSIEARSPKSLKIGSVDPSTQGPVEGMKVGLSGKSLTYSRVVAVKDPPLRPLDYIRDCLFLKVSNTPDKDRGKTIRLRFLLCDVDNPTHRYVRDVEAVIPMKDQ